MNKPSAHKIRFLLPGMLLVLSGLAAAQSTSVRILSPAAGATLSGHASLSAAAAGAATVDYWVAGHSIVTSHLPDSAPYAVDLDSASLWDGPIQIVAVARDSAGNVAAISQPVNVTIQNGTTKAQLLAPNLNQILSGQVTLQVQVGDSRGIYALIYIVDGKADRAHFVNLNTSGTDTYQLDTTQLANGTHYLVIQVIPNNGSTPRGTTQIVSQFTVNNGGSPLELRTNYRHIYFQSGSSAPVQLTPRLIYTDGTGQVISAALFQTDNPGVASVNGSGLVTAGGQQGIANITISAAGMSTTVMVTNMASRSGFPHFSKDGHILYDYDSSRSLWVRTLFFTNGQLFYTYDQAAHIGGAGFSAALHQAGVNAINSNFYSNPADDKSSSYENWQNVLGGRIQSWLDAARNNGFAFVGTGDDIQRNPAELNNTLNSPWAADTIRYTLGKLVASGNVVSIEMQDEVGGAVTQDFRRVMSIMNSAPARPPVTWPPAGLQSPGIFAAWMGDPTLSDYASMYWTYPFNFRPEFSWGNSLWQTRNVLDQTVLGKLAGLQIDKPKYMEVQATGPSYFKHVAGDHFQFGLDELALASTPPEALTAEILYAAAAGFSGVRAYGYDGASGVSDGLWAIQRAAAPLDPNGQNMQQTGASPFSNDQGVRDRWEALSNAFNVIQTLEPYMLAPQVNAVDLGPNIFTGARQTRDGTGRMLIAVNMADNVAALRVDLSPYLYSGASSITRYHVCGLVSTTESVPNVAVENVTLAPGETLIWIFNGSGTDPGTPPGTTASPRVSISSPKAGDTVSGKITVAATASSARLGVATLQFKVDGQITGVGASTAPYALLFPNLTWRIVLDTATLSDGAHTISAIATDSQGNQGTSALVSVTVNNQSQPSNPGPGLVAEWLFTDGSGDTAVDTSGNRHNLRLSGGPAWSPASACKLATCLTFNGVNQSAGTSLDLSGTKAVTVAFWLKSPGFNNNDGLALEFASSPFGFNGSTGGFLVDPDSSQSGGGYFEAGMKGDAGYNQVLFSRPSANVWHHYAIVFNKSAAAPLQVTPYVDGNPVSYTKMTSAANTNAFANDTLNVMSRNGQVLFGGGSLQDLQVYSRALAAAEVAALARK